MRARTGTAQLPLHGGKALRAAIGRAGTDRSECVRALKRLVRFGDDRVRARLKGPPE
jgi:hypothetical protein